MKRFIAITLLTLTVLISPFGQTSSRRDFSGVWKLRAKSSEVWVIKHQEPEVSVIMKIEDGLGKRIMELKAMTDGQEYKQVVDGSPATVIAKWDGDALVWNLKRETPRMVLHGQRSFTLSKDANTLFADKVWFSPGRETRTVEIWDRQTESTDVAPIKQ